MDVALQSCRYEGFVLWPYADDLKCEEIEARWPDALVYADAQLFDVLSDAHLVRFVADSSRPTVLRCVWRDEGKRERAQRGRWGASWATTIESSDARWDPAALVWIRYSTSISCKPYA